MLVGYDGFRDLIEDEKAENGNLKDAADDFDVSLACKRFPSIILGSSPPVKLYDETIHFSEMRSLLAAKSFEGLLPNAVGMKLVDPDGLFEQWLPGNTLSNVSSSKSEELRDENSCIISESRAKKTYTFRELKVENLHTLPLYSQDITLETQEKLANKVSMEESSTKLGPESQLNSALLDRPISCIPGLSNRQCRQLENCGFHTVGLLDIIYIKKGPFRFL